MLTIHLILTGASGYLGQHLLAHWMDRQDGLASKITAVVTLPNIADVVPDENNDDCHKNFCYKITALYHRLDGFPEAVKKVCEEQLCGDDSHPITFQSVDLTDPKSMEDLQRSLHKQSQEDGDGTITTIVIHTAAMSSPKSCDQDPSNARAVNIPVHFFKAAQDYPMIALSTDQVYDGKQQPSDSLYYRETEQDGLKPVNSYGKTKLEMEQYLVEQYSQKKKQSSLLPSLYLLRSSIILGPTAPFGGAHGTFLDFCQSQGENQKETTFFTNEYRTVVSVQHVLQVIDDIIVKIMQQQPQSEVGDDHVTPCHIFNMGGPIRVNRWDMAKAVFDYFGYDEKLLLEAEQTSPTSPLDISMDSSLLQQCKFGGSHQPETLQGLVEYAFKSSNKKRRVE